MGHPPKHLTDVSVVCWSFPTLKSSTKVKTTRSQTARHNALSSIGKVLATQKWEPGCAIIISYAYALVDCVKEASIRAPLLRHSGGNGPVLLSLIRHVEHAQSTEAGRMLQRAGSRLSWVSVWKSAGACEHIHSVCQGVLCVFVLVKACRR